MNIGDEYRYYGAKVTICEAPHGDPIPSNSVWVMNHERDYVHWVAIDNLQPVNAWNGEGLPPAGAKCELMNCGHWYKGVIKYISDTYTIINIDGQGEQHFHSSGLTFRNIDSEFDKLVDEAKRELMIGYDCDEINIATCVVRDLIKAGYRKVNS